MFLLVELDYVRFQWSAGLPDFSWRRKTKPKICTKWQLPKYPKCPLSISNGHKIYEHFPF
jgi:hypothetical protein